MSDIQQRIGSILGLHRRNGDYHSLYGNCAQCTCGWKGAGHPDHVAGVLVSELGLTRDTRPHSRWAKDGKTLIHMSRYVTEWVPDAP